MTEQTQAVIDILGPALERLKQTDPYVAGTVARQVAAAIREAAKTDARNGIGALSGYQDSDPLFTLAIGIDLGVALAGILAREATEAANG